MDAYARYLASLHAGLITPEPVVDAAVRRVTGRAIVARQRIVAGEANEVYEIGFAEPPALIVRISRDKEKKFEQERWAIERCHALGVPVPRILWIEHLSSNAGPLDICIQEKLEGRVLTPSVVATTSRSDLRDIVVSLGEHLSRIHALRLEGFGYLDGAGRGAPAPATAGWSADDQAMLLDIAETGFSRHAMRRILDLSIAHARPIGDPRLVHNDMRAHHLMVEGASITGIIDWGEVSGEAPIHDFVHWDYWDEAVLPTAWLREGYGEAPLFAGRLRLSAHARASRLRAVRAVVVSWEALRRGRRGCTAQAVAGPRDRGRVLTIRRQPGWRVNSRTSAIGDDPQRARITS